MIETTLDLERRLVVIRMTGGFCDDDLLASREGGRTNPLFPPGFGQLIDLTAVTDLRLSTSGVSSLAETSSVLPGTKRAIVAPSDRSFGLSRMFAVYAERNGHTIHVFRSMREAMKWLSE